MPYAKRTKKGFFDGIDRIGRGFAVIKNNLLLHDSGKSQLVPCGMIGFWICMKLLFFRCCCNIDVLIRLMQRKQMVGQEIEWCNKIFPVVVYEMMGAAR